MTTTGSPDQTAQPLPQAQHLPPPNPKNPQFPPHNAPRVWFLTSATAPIAIALTRHLLAHGDYVVAGVLPSELEDQDGRGKELRTFLDEVRAQNGDKSLDHPSENGEGASSGAQGSASRKGKTWRDRLRIVPLNGSIVGQCQAAIAEAVDAFGRVDILLGCTSEAVVGTIEELAQSHRTLTLVRDQFERNFFANVNIIKAVLPEMRVRKNGHIVVLTGITGHLGTPGLGMFCASQWAIEGYCDSLAYETAPFNIKMTIVQPNLEINVLTNRITSVPPLPEYSPDVNPAPLSREILSGLLEKLDSSTTHKSHGPAPGADGSGQSHPDTDVPITDDVLSAPNITTLYPALGPAVKSALIAETVYALAAIGGHDNPPARHIVGFEGIASVKEKLKTVSEELEDFIEVSSAVDIARDEESSMSMAE